jgi:oligopeptide/dipeptide ABC transporter ATP-binding protein
MSDDHASPPDEDVIFSIRNLSVGYGAGKRGVRVIDGLDMSIARGEVLCLVGESGSGKSTLGKAILRLIPSDSSGLVFDGTDLSQIRGQQLRRLRSRMQIIFQDPYATLDPRMTVRELLSEPLEIHKSVPKRQRAEVIERALSDVSIPSSMLGSYPHELSGGQRQRVGIARALILDPELVVADEIVASLDVSIQAQIINMLTDLQRARQLTLLFISHDLAVVRQLADRVAVLYSGHLVEIGDRHDIYERPAHPYTRALLSAAPIPDPRAERERKRIVLQGDPPSPHHRIDGCRFASRCFLRAELGNPEICTTASPRLEPVGSAEGHRVACHFADGAKPPPALRGAHGHANNNDQRRMEHPGG